jgi:hypothetical protein
LIHVLARIVSRAGGDRHATNRDETAGASEAEHSSR